MPARRPTSLDLFCGAGGFSLGLEQAGFRTLAAVDFDQHAIAVYRANFPSVDHALHADLNQLTPAAFESQTGIRAAVTAPSSPAERSTRIADEGDVDVIVGGFATGRRAQHRIEHDHGRMSVSVAMTSTLPASRAGSESHKVSFGGFC